LGKKRRTKKLSSLTKQQRLAKKNPLKKKEKKGRQANP
jgi:hypothetical protein